MSNTIMATVYNHYMTTYSPRKSDARLDSHNKNELKNIYNNILKLNKEAPLYLYDRSSTTKNFAISLKENTRQLQHTILDTAGKEENDLFKNKVAYSSDEKVLTAKFIGEKQDDYDESFFYEIEVEKLASPQVNSGYLLDKEDKTLKPGNYSFDVTMNNIAYEFQFSVSNEDTNLDVQSKLARLFNQSNIGLKAEVMHGPDRTSALRVTSVQTGDGTPPGHPLFTIQSTSGNDQIDVVDFLGIDYIATESSNSYFKVNSIPNNSTANRFTIDKTFEIDLHNVTPDSGEPIMVGLKANVDSLKDNIYHLIGGYNSFLKAADEYKQLTSSNKLSYEMTNVARSYRNELDSIGINISEDGTLAVDDHLLTQTAQSDDAYNLLSPLKDFSTSLYEKGEEISRDPLSYANKKIVAYKNPGRNFTSPYATSNYSGLLFNYYC